ncbi:unnamed protein product [Alternaria alternata]
MQLTTILSVAILALGAAAQKTGPNGKRICAGGAISSDKLVSIHTLRQKKALPKPVIYIDLEGSNLCREGSVSILTLLVDLETSLKLAYLIDVHTLGEGAFNTAGVGKTTLKEVLQDEEIFKVFFDVRNDSDALFPHYGIAL